MKKVGTILFDIVVIPFVIIWVLSEEAWNWLKGLFADKQPPKEETSQDKYKCRCHQCGEEFRAAGVMMEGIPSRALLLIDPKECPKCGSIKIMPVMFEYSEFHVEGYQRMWERKAKKSI